MFDTRSRAREAQMSTKKASSGIIKFGVTTGPGGGSVLLWRQVSEQISLGPAASRKP